jgi:hypothetical protein
MDRVELRPRAEAPHKQEWSKIMIKRFAIIGLVLVALMNAGHAKAEALPPIGCGGPCPVAPYVSGSSAMAAGFLGFTVMIAYLNATYPSDHGVFEKVFDKVDYDYPVPAGPRNIRVNG